MKQDQITLEFRKALDVLVMIMRHDSAAPVKASQIEETVHVNPRTIAQIAAECQKRGLPICSSGNGYYRARNEQEWQEHLLKEKERAIKLLHKVSEAQKHPLDQFTLFESQRI